MVTFDRLLLPLWQSRLSSITSKSLAALAAPERVRRSRGEVADEVALEIMSTGAPVFWVRTKPLRRAIFP
jgi:hypothetical protein